MSERWQLAACQGEKPTDNAPRRRDYFPRSGRQARRAPDHLRKVRPWGSVRDPDEFDVAFEAAIRQRADALITVEDPLTTGHPDKIVEFAADHRLPAVYGQRELVEAGGLMAYGANFAELMRPAAKYVDKILKGMSPADLPIEQPTKFDLVINLKAQAAVRGSLRELTDYLG
jgi:putative tryptophan/tyrosine transport system substrate-binding protein